MPLVCDPALLSNLAQIESYSLLLEFMSQLLIWLNKIISTIKCHHLARMKIIHPKLHWMHAKDS